MSRNVDDQTSIMEVVFLMLLLLFLIARVLNRTHMAFHRHEFVMDEISILREEVRALRYDLCNISMEMAAKEAKNADQNEESDDDELGVGMQTPYSQISFYSHRIPPGISYIADSKVGWDMDTFYYGGSGFSSSPERHGFNLIMKRDISHMDESNMKYIPIPKGCDVWNLHPLNNKLIVHYNSKNLGVINDIHGIPASLKKINLNYDVLEFKRMTNISRFVIKTSHKILQLCSLNSNDTLNVITTFNLPSKCLNYTCKSTYNDGIIAFVCRDGQVRILDGSTGLSQAQFDYDVNQGSICLEMSDDLSLVAITNETYIISIFCTTTGQLKLEIDNTVDDPYDNEGCHYLIMHMYGQRLFASTQNQIEIFVYDVKTGARMYAFNHMTKEDFVPSDCLQDYECSYISALAVVGNGEKQKQLLIMTGSGVLFRYDLRKSTLLSTNKIVLMELDEFSD